RGAAGDAAPAHRRGPPRRDGDLRRLARLRGRPLALRVVVAGPAAGVPVDARRAAPPGAGAALVARLSARHPPGPPRRGGTAGWSGGCARARSGARPTP